MEKLLTPGSLQSLGFSRSRSYAIFQSADLRTVRIGRRLYVEEAELRRWLAARTAHPEVNSVAESVNERES